MSGVSTKEDHVSGVYWHEARKRWQIVFWRDGKRRTHYKVNRDQADDHAAELALELSGAAPVGEPAAPALPRGEGIRRGEWSKVLWELTEKVLANPTNEDLKSSLRTVSQAANAAAKFVDDAETQARLRQTEREVELIKRGRESGSDAHREQKGPAITPTDVLQ